MASRRCLRTLTKTTPFLFRNPSSFRSLTRPPFPLARASSPVFTKSASAFAQWPHLRYFSSDKQDDHSDEEDYSEEEDYEDDDDDDDDVPAVSSRKKVYTPEEKEAEAEAIGYRVVGPLPKDNDVFKPYEPVFAVVQVQLLKHSAMIRLLFLKLFFSFIKKKARLILFNTRSSNLLYLDSFVRPTLVIKFKAFRRNFN